MMTAEYWIALAITEAFTLAMAKMSFEGEKSKKTMVKYAAVMIGTAVLYTLICVAYGVI